MSGSNTSGKGPLRISDCYKAFPRQKQFHESKAKYRLFGGAAGPGKTKALLWEAIRQALKVAGCDTLLLRRTYPELESSLLAYFRRDVPRSLYKSYNESKHLVTWKNGSTTRFGYCRTESDVYQYQGAEFLFIGIDELTHFTYKQWQFLTSRNRCPVPGTFACMAGATNPGNIGHAWVKALWVDKVAPAELHSKLYDASDYEFIRARIDDNPIYANDAAYRRALETLPEHLRRAFLDGDWNVFAGQYFHIFDYGRHTARPEELRLEPWWPRWISIDWGFQHPSAVYWHCAVPALPGSVISSEARNLSASEAVNCQLSAVGSSHQSPVTSHQSRIVTYREFLQNGLSPRMLAQAIAERSGRESISNVFLSPDAFAQRTSEASIAEQLGEVLIANGLPRPAPADDDRVGGWQWMYELLLANAWVISEDCGELIHCLPQLVSDERRPEDVLKMDGDDAADSARYGLVSGGRLAGFGTGFLPSRAGQAPPYNSPAGAPHFVHGMPLDEQIARQISATDPTSRAIHSQRLESEAQKFFRPTPIPRRWRW
ncbi:MAG TPA: phage terminase large subunit [Candidatus Angelobacter sp.]|nr:phage terminase large subunit [Candidatus Angelobacter sp.]